MGLEQSQEFWRCLGDFGGVVMVLEVLEEFWRHQKVWVVLGILRKFWRGFGSVRGVLEKSEELWRRWRGFGDVGVSLEALE